MILFGFRKIRFKIIFHGLRSCLYIAWLLFKFRKTRTFCRIFLVGKRRVWLEM